MIRKITNRLYKVNTYAGYMILKVDDTYDEDIQHLRQELELDSLGYKLNLLAKLAELTMMDCVILSVTEFNADGSKPKVAYANDKDYIKIVKYLQKVMS